MSQVASPSHTFMFIIVYKCLLNCIVLPLLLASMSVFESPPRHSIKMDEDQMYNISSPDLREDALDDMLCRIHLQSDDPDLLEQEAERD